MTVRVAEVEAAAYVESPAKATVIVYVPVADGAAVLTEAMPRKLVVAVLVTPLRVKVTVFPATGVTGPARSQADRVIEAPLAALVEPK